MYYHGSGIAAELSALADILGLLLLDKNSYQFFIHPGNGDKRIGKFLNDPALLVARQAFLLSEYDDWHKNILQEMGGPDI